jgi:O-antigen/teichoic acid export membrane protein
MSISNIVGPLLLYIDRFLIGALISATAVTFYTTPYEVITKILIIPGALTGVLFPAISSTYTTNPVLTKNLLSKSIKYVFIIVFPIVLMIFTFAKEGMNLWLGVNFAENSTLILQLFATGILLNSVAFFPFTFLQSVGRPDITAKIHSVELPFYIIAMWYCIPKLGIIGAAMVWLLRIIVDAGLQFYFTKKVFKKLFNHDYHIHLVPTVISILLMLSTLIISEFILKLFYVFALLIMFSLIVWKKFLEPDERSLVFSKIRNYRFEK